MTEIWSSIVKNLEGKLDPKELKTWFAPTRQVAFESREDRAALTVSVPSPVFADWIRGRHGALLAREAAAAGFPDLDFRFQAAAVSIPPAPAAAPAPSLPRGLVLNPRFTFDTFVVGSSNQFAHAAARAVGSLPRARTTRSSCTAASASARPTSCTRSRTRSSGARRGCASRTSRPSVS